MKKKVGKPRKMRLYKPVTKTEIRGPGKSVSYGGLVLSRDEQIQIVAWLVELKSYGEIAALVKEHFGKTIHRQTVYHYAKSKRWRGIIQRVRARFERELSKIPIANKADRLRYYQKILNEALTWSLKTITADGTAIYELKLGDATNALKGAAEEMEGRKVHIDGNVKLDVRTVDEQGNPRPVGELVRDFTSQISSITRN